jgi:hypothetical protein
MDNTNIRQILKCVMSAGIGAIIGLIEAEVIAK